MSPPEPNMFYNITIKINMRAKIKFLWSNYEASNLGEIRLWDKILKQYKRKDGYMRVNLYVNWNLYSDMTVHRLVANAYLWLDLSMGRMQCCLHKNDIRDDNRLSNLFIWTYKDNAVDRASKNRGNNLKWSANKSSILNEKQVIEIKKSLFEANKTHSEIAKLYWVWRCTIQKIWSWKNRKHISI